MNLIKHHTQYSGEDVKTEREQRSREIEEMQKTREKESEEKN